MSDNNEFKVYLGIEIDKNAKTSLQAEIDKFNSKEISLKVGIDKNSISVLDTQISKIGERFKTINQQINGISGGNLTKALTTPLKESEKTVGNFSNRISDLTNKYKQGAVTAKEYSKIVNNMFSSLSGDGAKRVSNQLGTGEIKQYVDYLKSVQGLMGDVKPIGQLVSTERNSSITDGVGTLIRQVDTYKDKMGGVQRIISIIDKETNSLVAKTEMLTTSQIKGKNAIEMQRKSLGG